MAVTAKLRPSMSALFANINVFAIVFNLLTFGPGRIWLPLRGMVLGGFSAFVFGFLLLREIGGRTPSYTTD